MHKTTRELLQSAYTVEHHHPDFDGYDLNMDDADLRSAMQNWREAGYPDLADLEDKSPTLETCWTCGNAHGEDCYINDRHTGYKETAAWVREWCSIVIDLEDPERNIYGMPPLDYNGPPCPGWKAKE